MRRSSLLLLATLAFLTPAVVRAQGTSATAHSPAPRSSRVRSTSKPARPSGTAHLPVVSLGEALKKAEAKGQSFRIAEDTLRAARQQLNEARAVNGLSVNGSGAYFYQDNLPGASAPITTPSSLLSSGAAAQDAISQLSSNPVGNNYRAGAVVKGPSTNLSVTAEHLSETAGQKDQVSAVTVSGKQTLFDGYPGGRHTGKLKEARDSFRVAQISYESQLLSLKLDVKQAYYTLLGDQSAVSVRLANVAQAREDLSRVEGLVSADEATKLDVLQARVALGQARVALGSARDKVVIDRKQLSLAVGWPLGKRYRVANVPDPKAATLNLAKAVQTAFQHRPALRESTLKIASGRVALSLAKSQYIPVVSATAGVTFQHDWTAGYNMGTYNAGVSVSVPVFENGLLAAQVDRARAQLDSLEHQQSREQQSIEIAVQNAIFTVLQSKKSLSLARQSVAATEGQYSLEKEKRGAGLATNLDVLQASSSLAQAKAALEKARNSYDLAVLSLNNTLGL